jgi:hypothetical protein
MAQRAPLQLARPAVMRERHGHASSLATKQLKPILYPPWPPTSSTRNNLSVSLLWSAKMPSCDRLECCQSIRAFIEKGLATEGGETA